MISQVRDNVVTFRHTRTSASQAEHISHIVLLNQDDLAACVQKSSIIPLKGSCELKKGIYLSLEAPRARTMGSAISSIDCRMEATTMKRMMERRKARWITCSSIRPVWTARISKVMPSVIPLETGTYHYTTLIHSTQRSHTLEYIME